MRSPASVAIVCVLRLFDLRPEFRVVRNILEFGLTFPAKRAIINPPVQIDVGNEPANFVLVAAEEVAQVVSGSAALFQRPSVFHSERYDS